MPAEVLLSHNDVLKAEGQKLRKTFFISDVHHDDVDFRRRDVFGNTGEQLMKTFLAEVRAWPAREKFEFHLVILGDFWNSTAFMAEGFRESGELLEDIWDAFDLVTVIAGNHDIRLQGCSSLGYAESLAMRELGIMAEHGHRLDRAWNEKGILNGWIGEHIIKAGDRIETRWPMFDDRVMGLASRLFLPKGGRMADKPYEAEAIAMAETFPHFRLYLYGHTHRAWYRRFRVHVEGRQPKLITLANLNAWVPSVKNHPCGWYGRNEVAPYVFIWESDIFARIDACGLEAMRPPDAREVKVG